MKALINQIRAYEFGRADAVFFAWLVVVLVLMVVFGHHGNQVAAMAVGFTPGPWKVATTFYPLFKGAKAVVFTMQGDDGEPQSVCQTDNEANARLIAAAPELLEALKVAESHLSAIWRGVLERGISEPEMKAMAEIRAAIAKAEGK